MMNITSVCNGLHRGCFDDSLARRFRETIVVCGIPYTLLWGRTEWTGGMLIVFAVQEWRTSVVFFNFKLCIINLNAFSLDMTEVCQTGLTGKGRSGDFAERWRTAEEMKVIIAHLAFNKGFILLIASLANETRPGVIRRTCGRRKMLREEWANPGRHLLAQ